MGMVALSNVLVPLMVTGAYGVVVSLMFVKAHLGMTTCTPQLPVHHHYSLANIQAAPLLFSRHTSSMQHALQGANHCNQGQQLAKLQVL